MSAARKALRDGAVWGIAGLAVIAAHLGAGYALSRVTVVGAVPGLPDAIHIDMEALPPKGDALDTTPDSEDLASEESSPEQPEETEPDPAPQPEPVPPAPDFLPTLLTELPPLSELALADAAVLPPVSDARPVARPHRPKPEPKQRAKVKPKADRKPAKDKPKTPAAQASSRSGQRGDPDGVRTGRDSRGDGASRAQVASWQAQVGARIIRHMQRTRVQGRGQRVSINMRITIAANGSATGQLGRSTGDAQMDAALRRQAARLPRLPAPPGGRPVTVTLPVTIVFR